MTTDSEVMQMALDALDSDSPDIQLRAATTLRARLAQREEKPEPVAWCIVENGRTHGLVKSKPAVMNAEKWQPLYTAPLQRPWQGLTEQDTLQIRAEWEVRDYRLSELCRAIEAKLKEKNGY